MIVGHTKTDDKILNELKRCELYSFIGTDVTKIIEAYSKAFIDESTCLFEFKGKTRTLTKMYRRMFRITLDGDIFHHDTHSEWEEIDILPYDESNFKWIILNNCMYLIGGNENQNIEMKRYNIKKNKWENRKLHVQFLDNFTLTSSREGLIYKLFLKASIYGMLMGVYSPLDDEWKFIPSIDNNVFVDCSPIECKGKIYIIANYFISSEYFDIKSNSWIKFMNNIIPGNFKSTGLVSIGNCIYTLGGMNYEGRMSDQVLEYNVEKNTLTKVSWKLPNPRCNFNVKLLENNDIIITGGKREGVGVDNHREESCWKFSFSTMTWIRLPDAP